MNLPAYIRIHCRLVGVLGLLAMLVACATSIPPNAGISVEELNVLEANAANEPKNRDAQAKLADAYVKIFSASKKRRDLEQALTQTRKLLALDETHTGTRIVFYSLLADKVQVMGDTSVLPEMSELYKTTPQLSSIPVGPPVYYEAVAALKTHRGQDFSKIKENLKAAIREKPAFVNSHLLLAVIYRSEKQYELSIAILSQAEKAAPNDARVFAALGEAYVGQARAGGCSPERVTELRQSRDAFKSAIKLNPESPVYHRELAFIYELLGDGDLYLFEAQRYDELAKTPASGLLLADAMLAQGRIDDALRRYADLYAKHGPSPKLLNQYARARFDIGNWQGAISLWHEYEKRSRKPYFYGKLNEALATQKLEGIKGLRRVLMEWPADANLSDWERKILAFHMDKLSEKDFGADAKTLCQKVEADFYVGFQHWARGDTKLARQYFEKVTKKKQAYPFTEYISATYFLREISGKQGKPNQK